MDEPKSLFDVPTGERLRDEAIALAESNAPEFCAQVLRVIQVLREVDVTRRLYPEFVGHIKPRGTITTDDVWEALNKVGIASPPEPRAMGGAMRQAASRGLIAPTDQFELSKRPACHRRPVKVWTFV